MRGIYFMADDGYVDPAMALVNSIRARDPDIPLVLIPYRRPFVEAARLLAELGGVEVFDDLALLDRIDRRVQRTFGRGFFRRPENFRKQAAWFGRFDEFLYVDADVVVFERIADRLDWIRKCDFLTYSDQHLSGLEHVFKESIRASGVLGPDALADVFNAGFFGSRRGLLTEEDLYRWYADCARNRQYLDRSRGGSDQPVLNWMILRNVPRRLNLYRHTASPSGMWAGDPRFVTRGSSLFDPVAGRPLLFLHWAGMRIEPGAPYWDTWLHYRQLAGAADRPVAPPSPAPAAGGREGLCSRWFARFREMTQRLGVR